MVSSENRFRTIKTAYAEIKREDPDSAITEWAIRKIVTEGYIPSRRIGTKYVFAMEDLLDYFRVA